MSKKYNKLVRDKMPEIIKKRGQHPVTRILGDKDYVEQLLEKLCEEIDDFDQKRSVEELADVVEVLMALIRALGISQKQLKKVRDKKAKVCGSFERRVFLEKIEGAAT